MSYEMARTLLKVITAHGDSFESMAKNTNCKPTADYAARMAEECRNTVALTEKAIGTLEEIEKARSIGGPAAAPPPPQPPGQCSSTGEANTATSRG